MQCRGAVGVGRVRIVRSASNRCTRVPSPAFAAASSAPGSAAFVAVVPAHNSSKATRALRIAELEHARAVADLVHMDVNLVQQSQAQVHERRVERRLDVTVALQPTAAAAGENRDRQVVGNMPSLSPAPYRISVWSSSVPSPSGVAQLVEEAREELDTWYALIFAAAQLLRAVSVVRELVVALRAPRSRGRRCR